MSNFEYEDMFLKGTVEGYIERQKRGEILVEMYGGSSSGCNGLLNLTDLGFSCATIYRFGNNNHQFEVRYSQKPEVIGYADYDSQLRAYKFTLKEGAELPAVFADYRPLRLAEATIDEESRVATIIVGDEIITLSDVEVWCEDRVLLKDINSALAKSKSNTVTWKLKRIPDTSGKPRLYKEGAPSIANSQVTLTVSGYAIDDYGTLAYVGVVGHKTAINSIWATLLQSKQLNLYGTGKYQLLNVGTSKYTRVISPMPDYDSHHCAFVSNQALPGKWSPEDKTIYLLQFIGGDDTESQLVKRLNESLTLPILPEWGAVLMKHGALKGFIKSLTTGGDCISGIQIQVDAEWNTLVEDLLLSELLTV